MIIVNLFEFIFGHNMQRHLPHLHHLIKLLAAKARIKGMEGRRGEERRGSERRKGFIIFFNPKVVLLLLL